MKAIKVLLISIGAILAALIVIPLTILAGLFVWLKLTEETDDEEMELDDAICRGPIGHVPIGAWGGSSARPARQAGRTGCRANFVRSRLLDVRSAHPACGRQLDSHVRPRLIRYTVGS
jgi:hypothetical protein